MYIIPELFTDVLSFFMLKDSQPYALVIGANSQIGYFLLPRVVDVGFHVLALSRQQRSSHDPKITWIQTDFTSKGLTALQSYPISTLFHLAPLPLLPKLIPQLATLGVQRIIAFGSTSCYTKLNSPSDKDKIFAQDLQKAELALADICQQYKIAWTVFRPTLIYGNGTDKNISFIARFIRKFKFFPLVGRGQGLRQPVHADDLAEACLKALHCDTTYNQSYNLSGGETLSYKEMVVRIFKTLNQKPHFIYTPVQLLQISLFILSVLPKYQYLTIDMANRMNLDHCFEHNDAKKDFGYTPRVFVP